MYKDQILRAIIAAIIRFRKPIGVLTLSISIFSFFQLSKIKIDNSLSIWFVKDDATYESYTSFQKYSGSDEIIIASIPIEFEQLAVEGNCYLIIILFATYKRPTKFSYMQVTRTHKQ